MTALSPILHSSNTTGKISLRDIKANLRWQFYFFWSSRHFWLCILLRLRSSIMKEIIQAIIETGLVVKLRGTVCLCTFYCLKDGDKVARLSLKKALRNPGLSSGRLSEWGTICEVRIGWPYGFFSPAQNVCIKNRQSM